MVAEKIVKVRPANTVAPLANMKIIIVRKTVMKSMNRHFEWAVRPVALKS